MTASSKEAIAQRLGEARERTLELIEPLDDEQLNRVYSPILSPLAWDLGHIANFEELWLVQRIGSRQPLHGDLGRLYDAIENPRRIRGELPILRDAELRSYLADVRERSLEVLEQVELGPDAADPLLRGGFVYEMLLAHEHQHNETMLQLLQMVDGYQPRRVDPGPAAEPLGNGPEMVAVAAGESLIGAAQGFSYDNERPRHRVELAAFEIDRAPVTNGAYAEFVESVGAEPPLYWQRDGEGGWLRTAMGRAESLESRPARVARLLERGRGLCPLGRQAAAERGRVGGGRSGSQPPSAPTSTSSPLAPPRPGPMLTAPQIAVRCRCWATSGSGPPLTSSPTRALSRFPTLSTPRSSSGMPTRCCAAAPGPPGGRRYGPASATGTFRSVARSSPAFAARGTLTDPLPHTRRRV